MVYSLSCCAYLPPLINPPSSVNEADVAKVEFANPVIVLFVNVSVESTLTKVLYAFSPTSTLHLSDDSSNTIFDKSGATPPPFETTPIDMLAPDSTFEPGNSPILNAFDAFSDYVGYLPYPDTRFDIPPTPDGEDSLRFKTNTHDSVVDKIKLGQTPILDTSLRGNIYNHNNPPSLTSQALFVTNIKKSQKLKRTDV